MEKKCISERISECHVNVENFVVVYSIIHIFMVKDPTKYIVTG